MKLTNIKPDVYTVKVNHTLYLHQLYFDSDVDKIFLVITTDMVYMLQAYSEIRHYA